jgi:predicted outer membrane repeat protein
MYGFPDWDTNREIWYLRDLGITDVFLSINTRKLDPTQHPDYVARIVEFLTLARDPSQPYISIHAMTLEDSCYAEEDYRVNAIAHIDRILTFNTTYPQHSFDGIHVNIEPHANDRWSSSDPEGPGNQTLLTEYRDNLKEIHDTILQHPSSHPAFSATLAHFYDSYPNLSMVHADNLVAILDFAVPLPFNGVKQTPAQAASYEVGHIDTFVGLGAHLKKTVQELNAEINDVQTALGLQPHFLGVGVFNWRHYKRLTYRRYVCKDAAGANDGTCWSDAYTELSTALANAVDGDEIWVAQGTYCPDASGLPDRRDATFPLKKRVEVYGGFWGDETEREQRRPGLWQTILTGDLDGAGSPVSDGAYHVLLAEHVGRTTILDGFTVRGGYADRVGPGVPHWKGCGGGLCCVSASPTVQCCRFEENFAKRDGGAAAAYGCHEPVLRHCSFSNNNAAHSGGAIYGHNTDPTASHISVDRCSFHENESENSGGAVAAHGNCRLDFTCSLLNGNRVGSGTGKGGAVYADGYRSMLLIRSCTLTNNGPTGKGGAVAGAELLALFMTNSILWDNKAGTGNNLSTAAWMTRIHNCCLENGQASCDITEINYGNLPGGIDYRDNIDSSPQFVQKDGPDAKRGTSDDNLRLQPTSPCINAGRRQHLSEEVDTDLDGNPRRVGPPGTEVLDMGAYEVQEDKILWPLGFSYHPNGMNTSFGPRMNYREWDFHDGIDLPAPIGTPIYAAAKGQVTQAGGATNGWSSNHVVIKVDGQNLWLCHMHLAKVLVPSNKGVFQGQQIGTVGKDKATYPHLHFEMREGTDDQESSVHPLHHLRYMGTKNFEKPRQDRLNIFESGPAFRYMFGCDDRNEGDLESLTIKFYDLNGNEMSAYTRNVDFDGPRVGIKGGTGDQNLWENDTGIEGYQRSNMSEDRRRDLHYGVLLRKLDSDAKKLEITVSDVSNHSVVSDRIVIPAGLAGEQVDYPLDCTTIAGFDTDSLPAGDYFVDPDNRWKVLWKGGRVYTVTKEKNYQGKKTQMIRCVDTSNDAQTGRACLEVKLPWPTDSTLNWKRRFEWIAQGRFKIQSPLNLTGTQRIYLLYFRNEGTVSTKALSVAVYVKKVGTKYIARVIRRETLGGDSTDYHSNSKYPEVEVNLDKWHRWRLHVLRLGTRESTAVLCIDSNVCAREDWDTRFLEPRSMRIGIAYSSPGVTGSVLLDEPLLTEKTDGYRLT